MPEIVEGKYAGEFIVSEANGSRSREVVTVLSGQNVVAGEVLGRVLSGAAVGAAAAGNTGGSGAITAAPAVAAGVKVGVYRAICMEPATNAGQFLVEDPDGITIGVATVAVEFVGGGLTFTIADATDFVAGDSFTITVAAGSGKYVAYDQDGADGRQVAAGIAYDNIDASLADVEGVAIVRDAEVNNAELSWPSDIEAGEQIVAETQLASLGIIVR